MPDFQLYPIAQNQIISYVEEKTQLIWIFVQAQIDMMYRKYLFVNSTIDLIQEMKSSIWS